MISLAHNCKHLFQTIRVDRIDAQEIIVSQIRPNTLLIVHLDAIGDYILVRNFIQSIRESERYRGWRITFCGNQVYRDLAEWLDQPWVDEFIWLDRDRFRFEASYRSGMIRDISQHGFEVAVCSSFSRIYYWGDTVIRASGARERVGNSGDTTNMSAWQKRRADRFYTHLVPASSGVMFEFQRNLEFFSGFIGEQVAINRPTIAVVRDKAREFIGRPFAVLVPGAGVTFRQWSATRFASVADHLYDVYGLAVVIAGSSSERTLAEKLVAHTRTAELINLVGRTSLPELTEIIASAQLVVANESSAVHLAAAVDTPLVCISNGNQIGRFSPYPQEFLAKARYIFPAEVQEGLQDLQWLAERFRIRSTLDINQISIDKVLTAVDGMLRQPSAK